MIKAVFFNRDFSGQLALPDSLGVQVERYGWHMIGGPDKAYLTAKAGADAWDLMKLLRCPVEIWDEGKCLWWGYVNRVTVPNIDQRIGLGLDELYNYVIVSYADGDTSAASDATSISEYGQKETRINNTNATQTEAEQSRNLYLADHKYARPEIEFSGGSSDISIECYGWYSTLNWKYYTDTDSTNTENTTQIKNMVTSAGQFLRGSIIEDTAGLTSDENRDGRSTALTYINQLLNAGTSNVRPLLAHVDRTRYLHVYERAAEPPNTSPDYLLRRDGRLETPLGQVVPDKECKVGIWVKVKDVPDTLAGFSAMRPAFLERAEYNVKQDKTTYRFANAYEQVRLSRYVADIISGGSGSGGSTYNPYSSLPYEPTTPAPKYACHKYVRSGSISGTKYLTFDISASPFDVGYGASSIVEITTESTYPVWKLLVPGIYSIIINLYFLGTDASQGGITLNVNRKTTGGYNYIGGLYQAIADPYPSGFSALGVSWSGKMKFIANTYLRASVAADTNDSSGWSVDSGEMVLTLERKT